MSGIRFGRGQDYQFFRQEDVRRRWELHSAVQFLNGFRGDAVAMSSFRRQVIRETSSVSVSDEQVIQSLARMLVAGEFLVVLPQRQQHRDPLNLREAAPAPAAPRPSASKEVVEDPPTFESGHDGVAQAAALIAAARAAFPFCEECAKHAAAEAIGKLAANPAAAKPAAKAKAAAPPPPAPPPPPAAAPAPPAPAVNTPAARTATPPPAPALKEEVPPPAKPAATPPAKDEEPAKKAAAKETYWVEIVLLGEDGQPIPQEEFIVELPDGRRETGQLDDKGTVRFSELLTSGTCRVCFPKLDKDAWQLATTEPKKTSVN